MRRMGFFKVFAIVLGLVVGLSAAAADYTIICDVSNPTDTLTFQSVTLAPSDTKTVSVQGCNFGCSHSTAAGSVSPDTGSCGSAMFLNGGTQVFTVSASGTGTAWVRGYYPGHGGTEIDFTFAPPAPTVSTVSSTVAYNSTGNNITLDITGTAASVAVATGASHGTATASGTTISYTPTTGYIGADSFTYTATNTGGTSTPATVNITISAPTITVSPSTLPVGSYNSDYSQNLSASGGAATYTFSVSAGSLPPGLALSAGVLSGTPSAPNSYDFTILATDSSTGTHATGSRAYTLVINKALQSALTVHAVSTTLTSGDAGTTLSTTGGSGTGAVSYDVTPVGGVSCNISGTTLTATGGAGYCAVTATKAADTNYSGYISPALTVTVDAAEQSTLVLNISTDSIRSGESAVTLSTTGGSGDGEVSYTISDSTGPDCSISGNILTSNGGSGTCSVYATKAASGDYAETTSLTREITVLEPIVISIDLYTLPPLWAGEDYSVTLSASGGTAPYTWAIESGSLPEGLSLSSDGVISGSTTTLIDREFLVVSATDSSDYHYVRTRCFRVSVHERPRPVVDAALQSHLTTTISSAIRYPQTQVLNITSHLESIHTAFNSGQAIPINIQNFRLKIPYAAGNAAFPFIKDIFTKKTVSKKSETPEEHARGFRLWAGGMLSYGTVDTAATSDGGHVSHFNTDGLSIGLDKKLHPNMIGGAAIGFGGEDNRIDTLGSKIQTHSTSGSVYISYQPKPKMTVDGLIGYADMDFDTHRYILDDNVIVAGHRTGHSWFASLAARTVIRGAQLSLEPSIRGNYTYSVLDPYQEYGDSSLALSYKEIKPHSSGITAGLAGEYAILGPRGTWFPTLRFYHTHSFAPTVSQGVYFANSGPANLSVVDSFSTPISLTNTRFGFRYEDRSKIQSELLLGYGIGVNRFIERSIRLDVKVPF